VVGCPKSLNSIYGSHGPLGVKIQKLLLNLITNKILTFLG
jgi:hypothetical protein